MKFARLGPLGSEKPVLIDDEAVFDLSSLPPDIDGDFLSSDGLARAAEARANGTLEEIAEYSELDRKVLADMAVNDPAAFTKLTQLVAEANAADAVK